MKITQLRMKYEGCNWDIYWAPGGCELKKSSNYIIIHLSSKIQFATVIKKICTSKQMLESINFSCIYTSSGVFPYWNSVQRKLFNSLSCTPLLWTYCFCWPICCITKSCITSKGIRVVTDNKVSSLPLLQFSSHC